MTKLRPSNDDLTYENTPSLIYTGYPLAEDIPVSFIELSYVQCNMQCVWNHGWGSWTLLVPGDVLKVVLVQTGQHFSLTAHHHSVLCIWAAPRQTNTYTQTTTPIWFLWVLSRSASRWFDVHGTPLTSDSDGYQCSLPLMTVLTDQPWLDKLNLQEEEKEEEEKRKGKRRRRNRRRRKRK